MSDKIVSRWTDNQGNRYETWTDNNGDNYLMWVDSKGVEHIVGSNGKSSGVFSMSSSTGYGTRSENAYTLPTGHEFDGYSQFIVNNNLNLTIPIVVLPESISDQVNAVYNKESVVGRSEAVVGYSDTSNRTISFTVRILQDMLPPGNNFKSVESYVNALRSLCYPVYTGGSVTSPSCSVHLGDLIFSGVCESCAVDYSGPVRNGERIQADVGLSFVKISSVPLGTSDVANASSLSTRKDRPSSTQSTFRLASQSFVRL